jgi:hypothetical protein
VRLRSVKCSLRSFCWDLPIEFLPDELKLFDTLSFPVLEIKPNCVVVSGVFGHVLVQTTGADSKESVHTHAKLLRVGEVFLGNFGAEINERRERLAGVSDAEDDFCVGEVFSENIGIHDPVEGRTDPCFVLAALVVDRADHDSLDVIKLEVMHVNSFLEEFNVVAKIRVKKSCKHNAHPVEN